MRVGLTGGIGSGKSEVAKIFEELGAFVIDTDESGAGSGSARTATASWRSRAFGRQVVRDGASTARRSPKSSFTIRRRAND